MKGNQTVIDLLRRAAQNEIAAILKYSTDVAIQDNIGLGKLVAITGKRAQEEMQHFDLLMDRMIFLEGVPPQWQPDPFKIDVDVLEQIATEAQMEHEGVAMYNDFIEQARLCGDNDTRALFERILADENRHALYLEGQLQQAELMTKSNWLSTLA
jgi:bacterioferritin